MQIYGPFRISTAQLTGAGSRIEPSPQSPQSRPGSPVDQLDLSAGVSQPDDMAAVAGGGQLRVERVAELRREIASGQYETPEKLDAALDRFLDRFA